MTLLIRQGPSSQLGCLGIRFLVHELWETHSDCSRLSVVRAMNVWNGKILMTWGCGWGQVLTAEMRSGEENGRRAQGGMSILSRGTELEVCGCAGRLEEGGETGELVTGVKGICECRLKEGTCEHSRGSTACEQCRTQMGHKQWVQSQ